MVPINDGKLTSAAAMNREWHTDHQLRGDGLGQSIRLNTLTSKVSRERNIKRVIVALNPTAASWVTDHPSNLPLESGKGDQPESQKSCSQMDWTY